MAEYSYNLGINQKNANLTIDLKKVKDPTTLNIWNGMSGQISINRKKNDLTITMYATKNATKSDYRMFYKYEYFVEWTSSADRYVEWYEYRQIGGKWDWYSYQQCENGMDNIIAQSISPGQVGDDNVTFYVYDKNFNLVKTGQYVCSNNEPENIVAAHGSEYTTSVVGTAVVDYSRILGKIYIKNANYYDGSNSVYLSTGQNMAEYELITASYTVEGTGKNHNNFTGSNFNEIFTGTYKVDNISTGAGNDTVDGGAGNDKIYVNGKGNKYITIENGGGNDVIYNAYKADSVTLDFDTNDLYFTKSGNNLVISRAYNSDYDNMNGTMLTNFFNKKPQGVNITVNGTSAVANLMSQFADNNLRLLVESQGTKISGSVYSDYISAGQKTKTVKAGNGDNIIITDANNKYAMSLSAGKGDDYYYLQNIDKKITITDAGNSSNGYDRITIDDSDYSPDKLFYFYDISLKKGNTYRETKLHILSVDNNTASAIKSRKGKLSENVVINNYQTKTGDDASGSIEYLQVYDGNTKYNLSYNCNELESSVVAWLQNNGYSSAMTAFKKADVNVAQELMDIYLSCTYKSTALA